MQIEAPNLIIQQPEEEMVEMEVGEDLHVAEEYDPMAFFAGPADLNQDHQEPDPNVGQAVDSSIIGKCTKYYEYRLIILIISLFIILSKNLNSNSTQQFCHVRKSHFRSNLLIK